MIAANVIGTAIEGKFFERSARRSLANKTELKWRYAKGCLPSLISQARL